MGIVPRAGIRLTTSAAVVTLLLTGCSSAVSDAERLLEESEAANVAEVIVWRDGIQITARDDDGGGTVISSSGRVSRTESVNSPVASLPLADMRLDELEARLKALECADDQGARATATATSTGRALHTLSCGPLDDSSGLVLLDGAVVQRFEDYTVDSLETALLTLSEITDHPVRLLEFEANSHRVSGRSLTVRTVADDCESEFRYGGDTRGMVVHNPCTGSGHGSDETFDLRGISGARVAEVMHRAAHESGRDVEEMTDISIEPRHGVLHVRIRFGTITDLWLGELR